MRILLAALLAILPVLVHAETVTGLRVDFARSAPTRSYAGFLHGVTETAPIYDLLRPLNIQYWRAANVRFSNDFEIEPVAYARMKAAAPRMKVQYLISDAWGYAECCRRTGLWPFENYSAWDGFVADVVYATQRAENKISYWEVWNEPAVPFFWAGSIDQFFDTYARTYRILRKQLGPDALIAGPSFSGYNSSLIRRFLDYCLVNRLQVNILTWHVNRNLPSPEIVAHVEDARTNFLHATEYRPLRLREIHIDEYGGPASKHSPAAMLGFLYYLEAAKPAVAAKSCWRDSKQRHECYNGSLDGLVDVDTMSPRAVWWAYKLYADGTPSRVMSITSDPSIIALGSRAAEAADHAQVLVANFGSLPASRRVDIVLENLDTLSFLSKSTAVAVTVKRLASTGEQPSKGPEVVQELVVPLGKQTAVVIPGFGADEVYVLDIKAGPPGV